MMTWRVLSWMGQGPNKLKLVQQVMLNKKIRMLSLSK